MEAATKVDPVLSADGKELTIKINGRFDFACHQAFRDAYERVNHTPKEFVIDLMNTTYMDSSALGMLLLLRDHAGGEKAVVRLINASADTRKILAISNFEKLFSVA
ncbi:STAS domain-containing protein [Pseudomonas sp. RIT-PI-S]|uniref:STAS domain-containing protein n=1 Tax=Pseudomonas sp. RIT-PI-S TaxID=3035295 RepID=UPI0021DAB598|nr:STAS domain-containing protein [Pseudomonas sp. RIT-PI-S]